MKIVQKILAGLGIITFLAVLFILFCSMNPQMTEKLGAMLHPGENEQVTEENSDVTGQNQVTTEDITADPSADPQATGADQGYTVTAELPEIISPVSGSDPYEAPAEESLEIPTQVQGKNGYQPVEEHQQEVPQNEAEQSAEAVGTGETGENETFDASFYPYYEMLSDGLRSLYKQIYANANALTGEFAPVVKVSADDLKNAFAAVCNDHPELFWLNTAYSCKVTNQGVIATVQLDYNRTADNLVTEKQRFEDAANQIIAGASGTNYEKGIYVHDALISQVSYDLNAEISQSAYSALVNGSTVCAGYARAFQYLMQKLNVPCYYCTGYSGENHAWNIISLEDGYYNADTTWDDTAPTTYDYFNCSDADFARDHVRKDLSIYLPACNGQTYRKLLASAPQTSDSADTSDTGTDTSGTKQSDNGNESTDAMTLADTGHTQEDVLTSIQAYYDDCYAQLMASGENSLTFTNVISDPALWNQIYQEYSSGAYQTGYVNRVLQEKEAGGFQIDLQLTALSDGYYLMTHKVTIQP